MIAITARSDFIGIIISIFIFILFVIQKRIETVEYMKGYLKVNLGSIIYDLIWLCCHYTGYFTGSQYDYAEISLKRVTYVLSFINWVVKLLLLIAVWISYDKALKKPKTEIKK